MRVGVRLAFGAGVGRAVLSESQSTARTAVHARWMIIEISRVDVVAEDGSDVFLAEVTAEPVTHVDPGDSVVATLPAVRIEISSFDVHISYQHVRRER